MYVCACEVVSRDNNGQKTNVTGASLMRCVAFRKSGQIEKSTSMLDHSRSHVSGFAVAASAGARP